MRVGWSGIVSQGWIVGGNRSDRNHKHRDLIAHRGVSDIGVAHK